MIEQLPVELRDRFTDMREMDLQVQSKSRPEKHLLYKHYQLSNDLCKTSLGYSRTHPHPPPPPWTVGMIEILSGGVLRALEIWVGEGFERKNLSSGVIFNENLDLFKRLL